jgi:hypothetical protein
LFENKLIEQSYPDSKGVLLQFEGRDLYNFRCRKEFTLIVYFQQHKTKKRSDVGWFDTALRELYLFQDLHHIIAWVGNQLFCLWARQKNPNSWMSHNSKYQKPS